MRTLSLVIPLFNEGNNIKALVQMFENSTLLTQGLLELILVDNGSMDNTGELISHFAHLYPWIKRMSLPKNINYGGGVLQGLQIARADFIGYLPGDLQTSAEDVALVWHELNKALDKSAHNTILAKGKRVIRKDGLNTRIVSFVYTFLTNFMFKLRVKDINGLPKIFHRSLLNILPENMFQTFVFDAQLLVYTHQHQWEIIETPVTFHARREGVSTWSKKRIRTYWLVFKQLLQLRMDIKS